MSTMTMPDLRGFDGRARQLITGAIAEGWTGRISSKGHWIGRAPDGRTTMSVPRKMDDRGRTGANAKATFAKWLRERHPEVSDAIEAAEAAADDGDPIVASVLAGAAFRRAEEAVATLEWPTEPEVPDGPTVVSSGPWMAHRNPSARGGAKYPSKAVIERQWSDGTVDYACAYPGCDYTRAAVARSVASHYGGAHRDAPVGPPTGVVPAVDYTEPITERTYQPTDRLVDALARFLMEQRFGDRLEARDLATLFLTWAHERPDLDDAEARERRDLTDSEILDRIRMLVGRPLQREVDEMKARLAETEGALLVAVHQRDEAVARFERVQHDLDALRDLVDGLGK